MAYRSTSRNALTLLSTVLLVISTIYLLRRSVLERAPDIDFRFIWTAGKLWAQGVDPYSPRYTALGRALFPTGNDIAYWLYPPQWWVIARPLAAFPVGIALTIWRGTNALMLLATAAALAWAVRLAQPATPTWLLVSLVAIMGLLEGTAQTLLLGQTSILVFAGFCLIAVALLTSGRLPMVAGLVLLLCKPQFAVPIVVCLAATAKWRGSVLVALILTGLATLPQVVQHGLLPTVQGMLGNIARHGQLPPNQPENLIGFSHLVWRFAGIKLANAWDIALDLVTTGALGLLLQRRGMDARDQAALAVGLIAPAMFFLPLHEYDTVALGPVALLAILLGGAPRYLAWAAVLVAFRPGIISAQFGNRDSGDLLALSLAGLFVLVAALILAVRQGSMLRADQRAAT